MEALGSAKTKVTHIVGCNLNGVFALDWMARKAAPLHIKRSVDGNVDYVKGIAGLGMEEALDFGSIFDRKDEEEGTFEMNNIMARKVPVEKITSPLQEEVGR